MSHEEAVIEKCGQCGRAGDDIARCGYGITCQVKAEGHARPIEDTDVVLHCELCNCTRAVPVSGIVHGKPLQEPMQCKRSQDNCEARVISRTTSPSVEPEAVAKPAARGKKA